ncbi:MAG TPA: peptidylprolyl isomerase [Candidatus Acidoferrales bacterium]|jgi:cyclophilin family peptidyl-prolyl cis-trans isomerase|nr:peptidylprolyl isomerase [Candidatus Acidoferrales bacterium]
MNNKSHRRIAATCLALYFFFSTIGWLSAAPVIAPIANVTVPAGKSLIIPITATVTNGRPLTYTITGGTNAMAIVTHPNDPFWKLNVAQACAPNAPGAFQTPFRGGFATVTNVGDMTFMLFPEYAPNTVSIFQGLSDSGFYNANTIFHRVINGFIIQGGDPLTNGSGGLVFEYNDEFNPQAIYSGYGQLALANSGKNTDGSQFFVTQTQFRSGDFAYTIFGQLVRGFDVLTNIVSTPVDANDRPLANEIITQASMVPDTADTVVTLVATNVAGITNTITVVADDGAGGRATNTFTAISVTDTNSNSQPFFFGNTVTNIVAPINTTVTNYINAVELDGEPLYWYPFYGNGVAQTNLAVSLTYQETNSVLKSLTYNVTNATGQLQFQVTSASGFAGQAAYTMIVSSSSLWHEYYEYGITPYPPYYVMTYYITFGDTSINAQASVVAPQLPGTYTNLLLATFTNGVAGSAVTNFAASIQWGDDSITAGVITTNLARMKEVLGSHTYTNSGTYPIAIAIQSVMGVTVVVSNTVTVVPPLSLTPAGQSMQVAWPAWAYQFGLQDSSNLAESVWADVTNYPALAGFQNVVSNTASSGNLFFRLKQ